MSLLFLYTVFLATTLPVLFPNWHALYFAPFIVLAFPRSALHVCLWWSLFAGFFVDLLSADTRLGHHALNYCLTTLILYRYRFLFFEDRVITLPAMTFFFSCLSTLLQVAMFYLASRTISLSWSWALYELLYIPLQSALFAIAAFAIPFSLLKLPFLRRL